MRTLNSSGSQRVSSGLQRLLSKEEDNSTAIVSSIRTLAAYTFCYETPVTALDTMSANGAWFGVCDS